MMIKKCGEFEITEYEPDDFESIAEIFENVYTETYPHFDPKFRESKRFRTILRDYVLPDSNVWTVKSDGKIIIGFLALKPNFVDQLYILKDFQNKGLGGFLIEQAKTIHPDFLELYTFAVNEKAIRFYEKHDFRIVERGIAPDEKMPDVKMRWDAAP